MYSINTYVQYSNSLYKILSIIDKNPPSCKNYFWIHYKVLCLDSNQIQVLCVSKDKYTVWPAYGI